MSRPYIQLGIEEIMGIVEQNKESLEVLQTVRRELTFRSTTRAKQLAIRVESLLTVMEIKPDSNAEDAIPKMVEEAVTQAQPSMEQEASLPVVPEIPPFDPASHDSTVEALNPELGEKAKILEYWRAVELFMPQSLPKIDPRATEPVYSVVPDFPPPWNKSHEHARKYPPPDCQWRYIVYAGGFKTKLISTKLEEVFGRDPETFDEWQEGEAALFSLTLTHKARPLLDTFVLSSAAWSLGRLVSPGPTQPGWLDGFEAVQEHLRRYLAEVYAVEPSDEEGRELIEKGFATGRPAPIATLFQVLERIGIFLNVQGFPMDRALRIRCVPVSYKKIYSTDDQDSLNSFFVRDLGKISRAISTGQNSAPLSTYLSPETYVQGIERLDVRKVNPLGFCWSKLQPTRFPSAKWPAPAHHPLVYSQQVAVNELVLDLAKEGLFAINGPPGTGKTTLLRDIISTLVVARAEALSALHAPEAGFSGSCGWQSGQFRKRVNLPLESLLGFDMVVASSNNGAVENVTLELPAMDSIDPSWRQEMDYFADYAQQLLGRPAWGLIAARLGNKENRRDFLSRFWFGDNQPGFRQFLEDAEKRVVDWKAAVKHFKQALQAEQQIRNSRETAWNAVLQFHNLSTRKSELEIILGNLRQQCAAKQASLRSQNQHVVECTATLEKARARRREHLSFRPTFWQTLITWGRAYREWNQEDHGYKLATDQAESVWTAQSNLLQNMETDFRAIEQAQRQKEQELTALNGEISTYQSIITKTQEELGSHFVATQEWQENESLREQSAPWADETWNLARARVFIAALQLHKAFVLANAKQFRQNLNALSDVLGGNLPADVPSAGIIGAWNTLFLLIPVISTTFASFDRLLPFHGASSIGWLFIDEAGQATPQAAIGALWRSRRAVVVGDPLQLEPIVSLPFTAQDALKRHFSVSNGWRPSETSCQGLADRTSKLGTFIPTDDEPLWVGSPLRVHRRCDDPMFTISNQVAYAGAMVFGTAARGDFINFPSTWLDVQSEDADSHWIPREGKVVMDLLSQLTQAGITPDQIFLISPFRSVASHLWNATRGYSGIRTGTIHRVQGKEADVVIFVLGGNPSRPGAKDWAAAKPNLVNVAVSRAKRRIYVVGNHNEWSQRNHFKILAHSLPVMNL